MTLARIPIIYERYYTIREGDKNMKKMHVAIDQAKLRIVIKREIRSFKTREMVEAFKKRHAEYFEMKDLTRLFDISLKSAMKIAKKMKKYALIFMESDNTTFNSNIKYLIHKKDIKNYLLQDCSMEYIERILEIETNTEDWMTDYFFRKNMEQTTEANTVFEVKKSQKEVRKVIDDILSGKIRLYSRDYVQSNLYKDREGEKDKNYSISTIDRLLKCVSILKIRWKDMKMPTVKLINPAEQFGYFRHVIYETSKRKTVKQMAFEEIGMLPVTTEKFPLISFDRAIHLGLKNTNGKMLTQNDVAGFARVTLNNKIFIGLIDLYQTNERLRVMTMGKNYEFPKGN